MSNNVKNENLFGFHSEYSWKTVCGKDNSGSDACACRVKQNNTIHGIVRGRDYNAYVDILFGIAERSPPQKTAQSNYAIRQGDNGKNTTNTVHSVFVTKI